jgi:N,N'-diacetyllegionaminate synthase
MSKKIRIGGRVVGEHAPCFIIAEAGVNHNGNIALAKKLVHSAKKAGADAVKFQTFKAEYIVSKDADKAEYQKRITGVHESQFDMIRKLELSETDFKELSDYAHKEEIIFLSSPFDRMSVDVLDTLGVPAFKIASGEITNLPLIKYIAQKGKPVILSTGMSTMAEIKEALQVINDEGTTDIVLLHCITSYPAKVESSNLRIMQTLRRAFKLPVGLSDHTIGITVPIAAVALGAAALEKHFTLDKNLPGPDHKASLTPEELNQMIIVVRQVEKAMGNGIKSPTEEEEEIKRVVRRSIVARVEISEGTLITEEMLDIKRPGTGVEPKYMNKIIGAIARCRIEQDEPLTMNKLEVRR